MVEGDDEPDEDASDNVVVVVVVVGPMRVFSRSFDDDSDCRVVAGVVVVVVEILLSTNMTMTAVVGPLRRLPNHDALEIISSFSLFFFL